MQRGKFKDWNQNQIINMRDIQLWTMKNIDKNVLELNLLNRKLNWVDLSSNL